MYCISYVAADAIQITFTEKNIATCSANVAALTQFLNEHHRDACIDIVPAYDSLTAFVDFPNVYPQTLSLYIEEFLQSKLSKETLASSARRISLPCCYEKTYGLDLEHLSRKVELSVDEIIQIHSKQSYHVYAIGFSPGFPYLGFIDERIAYPRLASPRVNVPKGSVGIADTQTGIYPSESPGGWNIIGRCPLSLFELNNENPGSLCVLRTGDVVNFEPISKNEYAALKRENISA